MSTSGTTHALNESSQFDMRVSECLSKAEIGTATASKVAKYAHSHPGAEFGPDQNCTFPTAGMKKAAANRLNPATRSLKGRHTLSNSANSSLRTTRIGVSDTTNSPV
jgi:hypothetical protein